MPLIPAGTLKSGAELASGEHANQTSFLTAPLQRDSVPKPKMLTIRKEQTAVFGEASRRDFEDRMIVHIRKFFPDHFAALQEEKTRQLVQFGIERAASHRIVNECDVCKFIDLMIAFGPGFEQDPSCPWAAKILGDTTIETPTKRVNMLHEHGIARLESRATREN